MTRDGSTRDQARASFGPILDVAVLTRLERLSEDGRVLDDLVNLFLKDAPLQYELVRDAAAGSDATAVYKAAHSLRGSSGVVGGVVLENICRRVEDEARAGNLPDPGDIVTLGQAINDTIAALKEELQRRGRP